MTGLFLGSSERGSALQKRGTRNIVTRDCLFALTRTQNMSASIQDGTFGVCQGFGLSRSLEEEQTVVSGVDGLFHSFYALGGIRLELPAAIELSQVYLLSLSRRVSLVLTKFLRFLHLVESLHCEFCVWLGRP